MKRWMAMAMGVGLITALVTSSGEAARQCPAEVTEAKVALSTAEAALRTGGRDHAGGRMHEVQTAKMQDVQAPRMQDVQAPRMQDVQAPKMQDVQAPKMQDVQAPRVREARTLIHEAEQACSRGDMDLSVRRAHQALELLK